jgi:hypothetical protein
VIDLHVFSYGALNLKQSPWKQLKARRKVVLAVPPVPSLNENQSLTDKGCRRVCTLGRKCCDLVGNADYKDLNQKSRVMDKEENSPYDKDKQERLRKFKTQGILLFYILLVPVFIYNRLLTLFLYTKKIFLRVQFQGT